MILNVRSWDENTDSYNAWAEEGNFLSYQIEHRFNESAMARITIADPDGSIMRKYDVDTISHEIFVGPGEITIEDPDNTDIFAGRIIKVQHDIQTYTVTIIAKDWSDQLEDDKINFDTRLDLDSDNDKGEQGLRESTLALDYAEDGVPVYTSGANYYVIDVNRSWNIDEFGGNSNNKYLIFTQAAAGDVTIILQPNAETVKTGTPSPAQSGSWFWVRTDDGSARINYEDNESNLIIEYMFPLIVTEGSLFNSISDARLKATWYHSGASGDTASLNLYETGTPALVPLILESPSDTAHTSTYRIPGEYLDNLTDANGDCSIRTNQYWNGVGTNTLELYFLQLEVDVDLNAHTSSIEITDTLRSSDDAATAGIYNTLKIDTDLSVANIGMFEGATYCIVDKINTYIGDLVADYDIVSVMTTSIENTDGILGRLFIERSPLQIIRDLAIVDKAVFWVTLGGKVLTYKRTFNSGAPTVLTDASVMNWAGEWDYNTLYNEYHIYGAKLKNREVYQESTSSTSKDTYVNTRVNVVRGTGIVTDRDAKVLADNLTGKDDDVLLHLRASFAGLSSLRLGGEVSITSTLLGLTAANYVITHWSFDSDAYQTNIRLQPRSSTGYVNHLIQGEQLKEGIKIISVAEADKTISTLPDSAKIS